jgi:hypothetical protein
MSNAWEVTKEDVLIVLGRHGETNKLSEAMEALEDQDGRVEDAALAYNAMSDQADSALNEIEDILLEEKILIGEKRCSPPTPASW